MKYTLLFVSVIALVHIFMVEAEEEAEFDASVPQERGCKARGDTCEKDCDCCGCFYKCHCPLDWFGGKWHPLGCSCVYGDKYICEKKKKDCPNV